MDQHNATVSLLAHQVRSFYTKRIPFRIYHGSTNTTRPSNHQRAQIINTSPLNHVLHINPSTKTALVEPNVPMDALVAATLAHDLVPPVVMEFPGITVGGGFAGTSGESSSFKYGFFDRTVNWVEIILANGEVVIASPTERADLFDGAAGSFGTLGVTTLLELRLADAKMFVELTYHPVSSAGEAVKRISALVKDGDDIDYIDGILFSQDRGVIMTGCLTNILPHGVQPQRFTRARDEWFYLHAQKLSANPRTIHIPITDYLFRYDRGAFWTGKYAFEYFKTPFNRLTRWLLDYFLHTRVMYHALHKSGFSKRYIIQDLALPHITAEQFIRYLDSTLQIYPLWICPLKHDQHISLHPHISSVKAQQDSGTDTTEMLNIGVWGPPNPNDHISSIKADEFISINRDLERRVHELGGMKWLYAQIYYTEKEFWNIYDRKWYDSLREKYSATTLPSVWEKVRFKSEDGDGTRLGSLKSLIWDVWPLSGLYGAWKGLRGGDYLLTDKK